MMTDIPENKFNDEVKKIEELTTNAEPFFRVSDIINQKEKGSNE